MYTVAAKIPQYLVTLIPFEAKRQQHCGSIRLSLSLLLYNIVFIGLPGKCPFQHNPCKLRRIMGFSVIRRCYGQLSQWR